jgi:hypothetical protein
MGVGSELAGDCAENASADQREHDGAPEREEGDGRGGEYRVLPGLV